jgi:hypothetical protein
MGRFDMQNLKLIPFKFAFLGLVSTLIITGCDSANLDYSYPRRGQDGLPTYEKETAGIFGEGGLTIFDSEGSSSDKNGTANSGIGVNSFLWRASLDTVAFMPLISADPFGGVIITDWYGPSASKNERYKITLFILGTSLRSDGIRAKVFRQESTTGDNWKDTSADQKLDRDLEDAILTRARQLRITSSKRVK